MKSRFSLITLAFAFLFLSFPAGTGLFAFGNRESEEEQVPVNTVWTLCITDPDISALPAGRQIIGDAVVKTLAGALVNVDFRLLGDEESAYYRDYAWAKFRADAAKAVLAKRNERDLLIYRGEASWKHRKNLKAIDEALVQLEEERAKVDALAPLVEGKPAFALSAVSAGGTYPRPPDPGGEIKFCTDQKADAFIALDLLEYHGRIFLGLRMYTLYSRSYSYEEAVLFSTEELSGAMDEISGRLAAAVSGVIPSGILVHAVPEDAMIVINNSFAGRGETEMQSRAPGTVEVAVSADNYVPFSVSMDLNPDELTELSIGLAPIGSYGFEATVPGSPGSKVFMGSLYVGETPLTLQLPRTEPVYITVETPEGEIGSVAYKENNLVKGRAQFVRKDEGAVSSAAFGTRVPVSPDEKRADRGRRGFYGAYGVFWVVLPAAIITGGIAKTFITSNNYVMSSGVLDDNPESRQKVYNSAVLGRNIQIGSNIFWGAALGVTFFQIFRYLYLSGGDAMPIVRAPPKGTEP